MQKPKKGSKEENNSAETVPTPPNLHFCPFFYSTIDPIQWPLFILQTKK